MGKLSIAILLVIVLLTVSITTGCGGGPAARYIEQGDELCEQGRFDEAIDEYTKAIRLDPGWEDPYWLRGLAYCELGQYERGIEDFNEAIRLCPEYGDTYYSRGVAYEEQGKKAEAIADFEKFISSDDIGNTDWIEMAKQRIEELSR